VDGHTPVTLDQALDPEDDELIPISREPFY
jgi:hypothetical protein